MALKYLHRINTKNMFFANQSVFGLQKIGIDVTPQSTLNILLKYINFTDNFIVPSVSQIILIGIVTVKMYLQNII